ncbi:glucuronate isomerase [Lepagella muris]|jgi:glucuronate isomerase|uniref:Glucuronate isomerase n=1 Tax=Lepagella muris TaxID=3032870 RepID=A0AC61REE1_9BACT|nr:glucuronate isomerase [Lepagella muris]ROT07075.1 glucuronate isomerase [Muribaculaceae bacterium Isolate-037 (Harlan)]TGY77964.1 glucuronate isomerase [Lepagella muris]THG51420.1 glucuronate isomerase [Bacteroidales bacterium]TKC56391.1 glucuronate isomerase [Bacteroidales bacterium]
MPFINENFLLETESARRLYREHASSLPIIDYHCHLSPKEIADDKQFSSITELWLGGDHYKWRAMRANGTDERYITGDADPWEKFQKWAETLPYTLRNPLYHWTHLELKTAFGIDKVLNPSTAREIYDACNELLKQPGFSARGLMERYNVEAVCTTDDPADSLEYHRRIRESGFKVKVLPAWRPDKAMAVDNPIAYNEYVDRLAEAAGMTIASYPDLLAALRNRHDFFASQGCNVADHGVSSFPWAECTEEEATTLFAKVRGGMALSQEEITKLQTAILLEICRMNHEKGWVQQFHFGPLRNVNSRMFRRLGPDTGFDTIGDYSCAIPIARFLDALDSDNRLAKTILYNLNPADNTWVAAMIANFQDGSVPGKIQMGSGWWFNDQLYGMEAQMNALSMQGLLSRFVGMLTDSRSFLSYPRHEYFRRVLCNLLGNDLEKGLIPEEEYERVGKMVEDICYYNTKNYFKF